MNSPKSSSKNTDLEIKSVALTPKSAVPSPTVTFPGEDPADFKKLRVEILQFLQPKTVAEEILVEKIARAEWHWQRYINLIDQAALFAYRRQAIVALQQKSLNAMMSLTVQQEALTLANELISSDFATRSAAEQKLAAEGIDRGDLVCLAFEHSMAITNACQSRIVMNEQLLRQYRAELRALQSDG